MYKTGHWYGEVKLKGGELRLLVWTQDEVDKMVEEIANAPHQCTCGRTYSNAALTNECFERHLVRR